MKKGIRFTISILVIFFMFFSSFTSAKTYRTKGMVVYIGSEDRIEGSPGFSQIVQVKVLDGKFANEIITVNHTYFRYSITSFPLSVGKRVILESHLNSQQQMNWRIINIWRAYYLRELLIIFLVLLIIFGRLKGLMSLTSLIISGIIIVNMMIPLILKGYNAVYVAILCSSIITIITFILITGFSLKTLIAIIGTMGGTISAGILSHIYSKVCGITGFANEEVMFLITNLGMNIDFRGLYMAGIIIGTIGVIMDVSMSIVSFLFEIKSKSPRISAMDLFSTGLKVGKDVMATMVNTIVLAYVGSSMPLILILTASDIPLLQSINSEIVTIEIIRSLAGSAGLILTIPFTCLLCCIFLYPSKRRVKRF